MNNPVQVGFSWSEYFKSASEHFGTLSASILAITYLVGYLIEFLYFSSIGIPEVGSDLAKLKYIEDGIIFFLWFVLLGGIGYMAIFLERSAGPRLHLVNDSLFSNLLAAIVPTSIMAAITIVPPIDFADDIAPPIAFILLFFCNITGYLWALTRIDRRPEPARARWRLTVAITLLLITVICDWFIFHRLGSRYLEKLAVDPGAAVRGLLGMAIFLLCATLFFQALVRLAKTAPTLQSPTEGTAYVVAMVFVLVGLFYMSLTAYAFAFFPRIPSARGGANFCGAPIVEIQTVDDLEKPGEPRKIVGERFRGIMIYATEDTIFVTKNGPETNPCLWVNTRKFPPIFGIPKEKVLLRKS